MNHDVKEICDRALSGRPPLPTGDEMLASVRAADRRRTLLVGTGAGAAAAAVLAAAATLTWQNLPGPTGGVVQIGAPPQVSTSASPSASEPSAPASSSSKPPPVPGRAVKTPMNHGATLDTALKAALPAGYTTRNRADYSTAPSTPSGPDELATAVEGRAFGLPVAAAVLTITKSGKQGTLAGYIVYDGRPDPAGDLCAADVTTRVGTPAATCQVITTGGRKVRVTTTTYAASGAATSATIFLGDGWLTVTEHLGALIPGQEQLPPDADPRAMAEAEADGQVPPPLTAAPFTAQKLAEVCARPALLPAA